MRRNDNRAESVHVIDPRAVYTRPDVFRVLRLSDKSLRAALAAGLRHSKRGKRYFFLGQWLLDWIAAGEIPLPPAAPDGTTAGSNGRTPLARQEAPHG